MSKRPFSFALITPSYAPDFSRCQLLCKSVEKFIAPLVKHYIIVDQRDKYLFLKLENKTTKVLTAQSILPWWIQQLPVVCRVWLSLKTPPLRGWIIQQIIKISAAQCIREDVSIFVDSDVVFVKPFDCNSLVRNAYVRLFRGSEGNSTQREMHYKWHQSASELLGLSDINMNIPDYIGNIITWRRDHVLQLCDYLEKISGKSWVETIARTWNFSEYVLYGIFNDRILGEQSGHYADANNICLDYWFPKSLSDEELQSFLDSIHPDQVAVMISAKANIPVDRYEHLLDKI